MTKTRSGRPQTRKTSTTSPVRRNIAIAGVLLGFVLGFVPGVVAAFGYVGWKKRKYKSPDIAVFISVAAAAFLPLALLGWALSASLPEGTLATASMAVGALGAAYWRLRPQSFPKDQQVDKATRLRPWMMIAAVIVYIAFTVGFIFLTLPRCADLSVMERVNSGQCK